MSNNNMSYSSTQAKLVGGFNPSEKYESNWIISPSRGEKEKKIETTNQ